MAVRARRWGFRKGLGLLLGLVGLTGILDASASATPRDVLTERQRLELRVLAARDAIRSDRIGNDSDGVIDKVVQWVNWPNWRNWGNWPNWNNWNNWGNWWNR